MICITATLTWSKICHLFARPDPAPRQIISPVLQGASPRCLQQETTRGVRGKSKRGGRVGRGRLAETWELLKQAITLHWKWLKRQPAIQTFRYFAAYFNSKPSLLFFSRPVIGFHCMLGALVKTVAYSFRENKWRHWLCGTEQNGFLQWPGAKVCIVLKILRKKKSLA